MTANLRHCSQVSRQATPDPSVLFTPTMCPGLMVIRKLGVPERAELTGSQHLYELAKLWDTVNHLLSME